MGNTTMVHGQIISGMVQEQHIMQMVMNMWVNFRNINGMERVSLPQHQAIDMTVNGSIISETVSGFKHMQMAPVMRAYGKEMFHMERERNTMQQHK